MICIYHSKDLDGWMSAAIIKLRFPDIKLIGWNYGESVPQILLSEPYHVVILVDVSFKPEEMKEVYNLVKGNFIWIDHHDRTIKDTEEYFGSTKIAGNRNTRFAACELTWNYFFAEKKMPELVRLLGRYDCFGHKGTHEEEKVLEFQYGARQCISNAEDALRYLNICLENENMADATIFEIWRKGTTIYQYLCNEARQVYALRFTKYFDDHRFAVVNKERFNPINFGIDYHKNGYDGFACFHYDNGKWVWSLYNDNGLVDCSLICKNRGGGGHKGAAGYQEKELHL